MSACGITKVNRFSEGRLSDLKRDCHFEAIWLKQKLPDCVNRTEREIIKNEIKLVINDEEYLRDLLIQIGVDTPIGFRFTSKNWNHPENTYEYRKQFKMMLKKHDHGTVTKRYTVRLWEEKQKKIEWDERMNGEPNYFYDLLPDLKEHIMDKVYRSCFNECMKELPTSNILLRWSYARDRYVYGLPLYYFAVDRSPSIWRWRLCKPYWSIDLRANGWHDEDGHYQTFRSKRDRRTETSITELREHLLINDFKLKSKMTKNQLIRLCMSF